MVGDLATDAEGAAAEEAQTRSRQTGCSKCPADSSGSVRRREVLALPSRRRPVGAVCHNAEFGSGPLSATNRSAQPRGRAIGTLISMMQLFFLQEHLSPTAALLGGPFFGASRLRSEE